MDPVSNTAALLSVAGLWGAMLFFAAVYAPLVFIKLEAAVAGRFIREVFPVYYLAMGVTSAIAVAALAISTPKRSHDVIVMAAVCVGFWVARYVLMPRINRARDEGLNGNAAAAARFKRLHRASVLINAVQLIAVLIVLARFTWA